MNEIRRAANISEEWLDLLDCLRIDCQNSPILTTSNDVVNNLTVLSMIDASYARVKENHRRMQKMLADLKSSLDAYYQLRSMEQNEVAILAESNNRAILIFTGVTIVFLPLSFFTSYFGMNLQGISGTTKGEPYFWEVCGSVALFVVTATVIYAFKESIHRWLLDRLPDPDKLV
ncbi:MAG: hypothetical protein M1824_005629 [Vezdaea acicularis]|nr:MAG: hypothetical protein M1824_005629 [Vezdaea acicularis]